MITVSPNPLNQEATDYSMLDPETAGTVVKLVKHQVNFKLQQDLLGKRDVLTAVLHLYATRAH